MLIQSEVLKVGADFRISIPVSEKSRKNGLITAIASEQETTLRIPSSSFRIELTTFVQRNIDTTEEDFEDFEFHYEPGVVYQFLPTLAVKVAYESKMAHHKHKDLTTVDNKEAAVQTGVKWNVTRYLNLNPYIDVSTKAPLSARTAKVGAELNWTIL
ncbi:hypothetical protein K2X30_13365 [bacterium]|nr:hypothetical protein [bacterium]